MALITQGALPHTTKMSRMTFCPPSDTEESDMEDQEMVESSDIFDIKKGEVTVESPNGTMVQEDKGVIDIEKSCSDIVVSDDGTADTYNTIAATVMRLDMIVKFPDFDEIIYETSCCSCLDDNGPFIISCTSGHALCTPCFQAAGNGVCKAQISDSPNSTMECGASFYEIDEAIMNTPYYVNFMQACQYKYGQVTPPLTNIILWTDRVRLKKGNEQMKVNYK